MANVHYLRSGKIKSAAQDWHFPPFWRQTCIIRCLYFFPWCKSFWFVWMLPSATKMGNSRKSSQRLYGILQNLDCKNVIKSLKDIHLFQVLSWKPWYFKCFLKHIQKLKRPSSTCCSLLCPSQKYFLKPTNKIPCLRSFDRKKRC